MSSVVKRPILPEAIGVADSAGEETEPDEDLIEATMESSDMPHQEIESKNKKASDLGSSEGKEKRLKEKSKSHIVSAGMFKQKGNEKKMELEEDKQTKMITRNKAVKRKDYIGGQ